jgi:hypothetical protein
VQQTAVHCRNGPIWPASTTTQTFLTYGARFIDLELAKEMVQEFLYTEFEGGRHMIQRRKNPLPYGLVEKIIIRIL